MASIGAAAPCRCHCPRTRPVQHNSHRHWPYITDVRSGATSFPFICVFRISAFIGVSTYISTYISAFANVGAISGSTSVQNI